MYSYTRSECDSRYAKIALTPYSPSAYDGMLDCGRYGTCVVHDRGSRRWMGGTNSGDAGVRRIGSSLVDRWRSAVFRQGHVTNDHPESSREVRPSRVTLKTVFTVCFGVLIGPHPCCYID